MPGNEDLPYNTGSSVLNDNTVKDPDQNNVPLLVQQLRDIDKLIEEHNSWDGLNLPTTPLTLEQKAGLFDSIVSHKQFVSHLRSFRENIVKKLEELGHAAR